MFIRNRTNVIYVSKCIYHIRNIAQQHPTDIKFMQCGYSTLRFENIWKAFSEPLRNQEEHNSKNTCCTGFAENMINQTDHHYSRCLTGHNLYSDIRAYTLQLWLTHRCDKQKNRFQSGLSNSYKDSNPFILMSFQEKFSSWTCFRKKHTNVASSFSRSLHSCRKQDTKFYHTSGLKTRPPWKIMFFGSDKISVDTLSALNENMNGPSPVVESLDVVTVHSKKLFRPPVLEYAEMVGLPTKKWPIQRIHGKYDVGIVTSFGKMIPMAVIQMFPYGILNMHPSMLPRWRGASPIIHTILNGDKTTGISIMEIRPKHFDIGPILLQRPFKVPDRVTSFQLADHLGKYGAKMVIECLHDLPTLERFEHEQDHMGITYAHKIQPVNANINWEDQTVHELDCQYRAISQLMPLRSLFKGQKVKLKDMLDPNLTSNIQEGMLDDRADSSGWTPGTVLFHKHLDCLLIRCKDGFAGFKTIVIRKELSAKEFYNGYLNQNGWEYFTSLENDLNKYTDKEYMESAA